MSFPSRRDMDEIWTSGRDMAISRTKIGERSSISPGDYDSIRALISISRPDEVDNDQICPMSRAFSVDLRWFGWFGDKCEWGLGVSEKSIKESPIYPRHRGSGWSEGPPKNSQSVFRASGRGQGRRLKKGRGQRSPLF